MPQETTFPCHGLYSEASGELQVPLALCEVDAYGRGMGRIGARPTCTHVLHMKPSRDIDKSSST